MDLATDTGRPRPTSRTTALPPPAPGPLCVPKQVRQVVVYGTGGWVPSSQPRRCPFRSRTTARSTVYVRKQAQPGATVADEIASKKVARAVVSARDPRLSASRQAFLSAHSMPPFLWRRMSEAGTAAPYHRRKLQTTPSLRLPSCSLCCPEWESPSD